jgi:hypothetical protein
LNFFGKKKEKMDYEYEKYLCTKKTLKETLENFGVAIIPRVFDQKECESMQRDMWETLAKLTQHFPLPIDQNNPETWRSFYDLFPLHSMLLQHHSIGHSSLAWNVRRNPKVVDIFAELWQVPAQELLTSFDGISVHFPPEVTNKGWLQPKNVSGLGALHSDQSFTRNDFECVQSWITAFDVHKEDATLTFLENSHRFHKEFAEKFNLQDPLDWYQLKKQEELDFFVTEKQCPKKSVHCPAGSMVFWDSRTIHAGQEAVKTRDVPNMRCVVYVCMLPRTEDAQLEKKQKAFLEQRTTNHNPRIIKLFPKAPRTYGKVVPKIEPLGPFELSPEEMKWAGFSLAFQQ